MFHSPPFRRITLYIPVSNSHCSANASISFLDKIHRNFVQLLNFSLEDLIPYQTCSRPHDSLDASFFQHLGCHHTCQVRDNSLAYGSGHLAKANISLKYNTFYIGRMQLFFLTSPESVGIFQKYDVEMINGSFMQHFINSPLEETARLYIQFM